MTHRIDSPHLDVIVIGAGPAGGSAARELAKRGKKVLLIERSQEIGEPNYSTAGTPMETVTHFELPKAVLSAPWDRILIATPRVQAVWEFKEPQGYVLDFAKKPLGFVLLVGIPAGVVIVDEIMKIFREVALIRRKKLFNARE